MFNGRAKAFFNFPDKSVFILMFAVEIKIAPRLKNVHTKQATMTHFRSRLKRDAPGPSGIRHFDHPGITLAR